MARTAKLQAEVVHLTPIKKFPPKKLSYLAKISLMEKPPS